MIALSEFTRRDIVDSYGVPTERVSVIPPAAPAGFGPVKDHQELQRVRQTYRIDCDYILSVGSIQPRKNLSRLVTAYSLLRKAKPDVKLPKLVLVGKCAWLYD